jgi:hypothetical protein
LAQHRSTFLADVVATLCLFGKVGDERLQFGALWVAGIEAPLAYEPLTP